MSTPTSDPFQDGWQYRLLEEIVGYLNGRDGVCGAWVLGSMTTNAAPGRWSDIDLLIVVEDWAFASFFPASNWVKAWGDFLALDESTDERGGLSRIFFADGRAVDVHVSSQSQVLDIANWHSRPFHNKPVSLLDCDPDLEAAIVGASPIPWTEIDAGEISDLSSRFFLWAISAIRTVAKRDFLIAAHMANELVQMRLVAAMMVRNSRAQSEIHKAGEGTLELEADLPAITNSGSSILEAVLDACQKFSIDMDELGHDCSKEMAAVRALI